MVYRWARYWPVLTVILMAAAGLIFETVFTSEVDTLDRLVTVSQATTQEIVQPRIIQLNYEGSLAAIHVNSSTQSLRNSLRMYETADSTVRWELFPDDRKFAEGYMLGFTPDSDEFVITGRDAETNDEYIWYVDVANGETVDEIALEEDESALAATSTRALTRSNDRTLNVYERESGDVLQSLEFPRRISFARFLPERNLILVAHGAPDENGYAMYLVDLDTSEIGDPDFVVPNLPTVDSDRVFLSDDESRIIVGVIDGQAIDVIDLETGAKVLEITRNQLPVGEVREPRIVGFGFINESQDVTYLGNDGTLFAINLESGQQLQSFDASTGVLPNMMAVSGDGHIVGVVNDENINFWSDIQE